MRLTWSLLSLVVVSVGIIGCSGGTPPPAEGPAPGAKPQKAPAPPPVVPFEEFNKKK